MYFYLNVGVAVLKVGVSRFMRILFFHFYRWCEREMSERMIAIHTHTQQNSPQSTHSHTIQNKFKSPFFSYTPHIHHGRKSTIRNYSKPTAVYQSLLNSKRRFQGFKVENLKKKLKNQMERRRGNSSFLSSSYFFNFNIPKTIIGEG